MRIRVKLLKELISKDSRYKDILYNEYISYWKPNTQRDWTKVNKLITYKPDKYNEHKREPH